MAGEVRNPQRTLPRALAFGLLAVTALYVLLTALFLYLVPCSEITTNQMFAAQVGEALFGPVGGRIIATVVIVVVVGTLTSILMSAPRVYYAMARDGLFLPALAVIHVRLGTPARAIILQAVLSSILVFSGTFDQVLAYFIFVTFLFLALTVAAVFTLRPRSQMPGYPWTPLFFLGLISCLLVLLFLNNPSRALIGVSVVALGIPMYRLVAPRTGRGTPPPDTATAS